MSLLKATDTFDTIARLTKENEELRAEVERLKAGDFTDEEFQNLCHCIPEQNRDEFFKGCAEYQRRLFGVADIDARSLELSLFEDLLKEWNTPEEDEAWKDL